MSLHWTISSAIAISLVAAPLAAQRMSQDTTGLSATPIAAAAPSVESSVIGARAPLVAPAQVNAAVGIRARVIDVAPARSMIARDGATNPAMMIVGGAALLVGAVVGGQAGGTIMVGGAVIGLIGLWNYLK